MIVKTASVFLSALFLLSAIATLIDSEATSKGGRHRGENKVKTQAQIQRGEQHFRRDLSKRRLGLALISVLDVALL